MDLIVSFLVICIVLFVLFLMGLGFYGMWAAATGNRGHKNRKARLLDTLRAETFNGDRETVPYEWVNFQPATRHEIIQMADEQGYRLVSSSDEKFKSAMYFEKRQPAPSPITSTDWLR